MAALKGSDGDGGSIGIFRRTYPLHIETETQKHVKEAVSWTHYTSLCR
jgi:hypothetical protein